MISRIGLAILGFLASHPDLVAYGFAALAIYLIAPLVLLFDRKLAHWSPGTVAALRSVGFDAPALVRLIVRFGTIILHRRFPTIAPQPEVVASKIKQIEEESKPAKPPPLPLLVVLLVAGCTHAEQVQAANGQRTTGHGTARTLDEHCDYIAVEQLPEAERRPRAAELDSLGCDVAWAAQTALSKAHDTQVKAIRAAAKGDCVIGAPRSTPACRLEELADETLEAGIALANASAAVVQAVNAARAR